MGISPFSLAIYACGFVDNIAARYCGLHLFDHTHHTGGEWKFDGIKFVEEITIDTRKPTIQRKSVTLPFCSTAERRHDHVQIVRISAQSRRKFAIVFSVHHVCCRT
eukprot:GHVU01063274.1.p4 GENE.GHVU01063274.1~~GHVU01063274.1.p4  ORF type:complete len:106 (-),score=1.33 GHVU01063274.1:169-486(-)